jgi:menaquinone-dependent protoporphyrinogen oxidase
MSVLVAFASKHGTTREVAERVRDRLSAAGAEVELSSAGRVADVSAYGAVVLGAGIYMGRLHPEARALLERLAGVRCAIFALGPDSSAEEKLAESRAQLDGALRKARGVEPVAVAVFGGAFDPRKHRFPLNRLPEFDARDWDAIDAWADELASLLVPTPV